MPALITSTWKVSPMPDGADQVLQLQRDFGALLRQHAILKGVGKLRLFANAQQELRLRQQSQIASVRPRALASVAREVHVSGDVLFPRSQVRRRRGNMLPVSHQRVAMAARKLLLAGVAIVNEHHKAAPAFA